MKRQLALYFSSEFFLSLGIGVVMYAQPFLYKSGGLNDNLVGVLFSISSLFAGVSALLLGPVADWFGASRVFKLSTLLMGVSYAVMGTFHHFWPWTFASALSGVAVGLLMSTENVVLSSLTKGYEKAGVLSKFVSIYMLLISMGTVLAGYLSTRIGYMDTVRVGAAITLTAPLIRSWIQAPDEKSERALRLPSRHVALMSVYAIIIGMAMGILNPFVTLILHNQFRLSNDMTAVVQGLSSVMMSVGAFMVSTLLRQFKYGRTLFMSFALAALATVGMSLGGGPWFFAGGYLLRTVFLTIPGPIVDARFLNLSRESEFSQMFGTRVFGNNAGSAVGNYAGGVLLNHNSLVAILVLSALLMLAAYAYLLFLFRRLNSHPSLPAAPGSPETAVLSE